MENPQRRAGVAAPLPVRAKRKLFGIANTGAAERQTCLLSRSPFAVHAVDPGDTEDAGLHRDFDLVAHAKTIVVIGIHRQTFHFFTGPPGTHHYSPRAALQSLQDKLSFLARVD